MLSASFLEFIKKENLFEKNEHLLIAISGGLDSVVLAHLLKQNNYKFSLAHMNFQLRGEDSNKDEDFVRALAKELEVEIFVEKVKIDADSGSTQIQARELRYQWFEQLMQNYSFTKLLTAHHANDLLETALLNLVRGTGIKGLRSILPLQNQIARPLLFAEKKELEEFAVKNSIEWREDSSNASDHYTRNKIRHHVMPHLIEINPNLLTGFQQTSLRLRAIEAAWEEKLKEIADNYFQFEMNTISIDKSILKHSHALIYLSEILTEYGFSLQQLQSFEFNRIGAQLLNADYVLSVDRNQLLITKINRSEILDYFPHTFNVKENLIETPFGNLRLQMIKREEVKFSDKQNVAFVSLDRLKDPLKIDLWRKGDKIQPLGMRGKKKISDILIDQKIPLPQKEKVMVLRSANEIVWVLGHKLSDLYKVKEDTKKILRIEYENS